MPTDNRIGCGRLYNKEFAAIGIADIVLWDVVSVADEEVVRIRFDSVNSKYRQGIWLRTDGGIEIEGQRYASVDLWYDTAPKEVLCTCHTKNGCLSVYNIYMESGHRMSQTASSGMRIEEFNNGRTYCCNDVGFETNFDTLIFHIERVKTEKA